MNTEIQNPATTPKPKNTNHLSEWREVKLGDLGIVITGKTPSSKFPDEFGNTMPFITPTDYKNYNKWIESSERYLSEKGIKKLKNKIIPPNSVLVTCIGSDMGKVAMNKVNVITNQQINSIIPNDKINPDFLYYKLIESYDILRTYGEAGTAVPILNKSDFEKIKIIIPECKNFQIAIAEVLSSLDDKIDLLHRQNKTLEALAETLFRQWFVEEAKEEWEEVRLGSIIEIINGVSYKSDDLNSSKTAMVTLKSFDRNGGFRMDGFKEYTGKYKEQHILKEGDLVVAHTDITQEADVIGNPVMVIGNPKYDTLVFSMDLVKVISKDENYSNEFLYLLMKSREFKEHCLGYSNGSTVLHLSKKAVPEYEMKLPPKNLIKEFSKKVKPLVQKQFRNQIQIRTLTALRDTLLPKLMSGEVRVDF
jgi:type I restriction enzyme S subunit